MGLRLGIFYNKEKEDQENKFKTLQTNVLKYLLRPKADSNLNPFETFKDHLKYGYPTLEAFIDVIPSSTISEIQEIIDNRKDEENLDDHSFIITQGVRFVLKENPRIAGVCTRIDVEYWNESEYDVFIFLALDRRDSWIWTGRPKSYRLQDLIYEKTYLNGFLHESTPLFMEDEPKTKRVCLNVQHAEVTVKMEEIPLEESLKTDSNRKSKNTKFSWEQQKSSDSNSASLSQNPNPKPLPKLYSVHETFVNPNDQQGIPFESNNGELDPSPPTSETNQSSSYKGKSKKRQKGKSKSNDRKKPYETDFRQSPISIPKLDQSVGTRKKAIPQENKNKLVGSCNGIQGRNNSCYMDALLFTLFYSTDIFDQSFLVDKPGQDSDLAKSLRNILRNKIVSPLRENFYCPSENVGKFRQFLSQFDSRIRGAMMDVDEIIYLILQEVCQEEGYFEYVEGTKEFTHQIMFDAEDDSSKIGSLQMLLEKSFILWGELQLKSVPYPGFLVKIPRCDGELVHFKAVVPNSELKLTSLILERDCYNCQTKTAEWECRTISSSSQKHFKSYCDGCLNNDQLALSDQELGTTLEFISLVSMDLFAVICIRSAHYVAFVRNISDPEGYLFFDSMAGAYPEVSNAKGKFSKMENMLLNNGKFPLRSYSNQIDRVSTDGHICIYLPRIRQIKCEQVESQLL